MRTIPSRTSQVPTQAIEADVASRVEALFKRCPMLAGFSVQDEAGLGEDRDAVSLEGGLALADIAVHAWPGFQASELLQDEIAEAMLDLLEERPEAGELLRGRTFARTRH